MYDIKPLEKKWEKYNKKKRRPWYIAVISFLFIILVGFALFSHNSTKKIIENVKTPVVKKSSSVLLNKSISTLALKDKIEPKNIINPIDDIPIEVIKKPVIVSKPREKIHLNIIQTTDTNAYEDVANRFYATHDIDDSLFLAKSYYRAGNYKKAEYWALETNKINGNIEESWLIFINSKIKMKHKDEAIRILNSYIKRSNSQRAKDLLEKIRDAK